MAQYVAYFSSNDEILEELEDVFMVIYAMMYVNMFALTRERFLILTS